MEQLETLTHLDERTERGLGLRRRVGDADEGGPEQAREPFAALRVASHPEQVLADARGDVDRARRDVAGAEPWPSQRHARHRPTGEHPRVLARAARLHRHDVALLWSNARERARHDRVAVRRGDREDAQRRCPRHDGAVLVAPRRRVREAHPLLGDVGVRLAMHAVDEARATGSVELVAEDGLHLHRRIRGLDDQLVEMRDDVLESGRLSAPPRRDRRHRELLAEEPLAQRGIEAGESARLEDGAAERVRHEHVARANDVEEPRNAERRVGAQLDRVAEVVVEPAQDRVHAPEPAERLQVDAVAANDEVLPFDERKAEIASEERVLEVRLVVRTGSEQDRERRLTARRRESEERVLKITKERRELLDLELAERVREGSRERHAVLERVAGARRTARAIGEHPPAAVGAACEICGVDVHEHAAGRRDVLRRPEKAALAEDERGRDEAVREQLLRAVEIREHRVEQARALRDGRRDRSPLVRREDERQEIELPRPARPFRIGVDVVGDAVRGDGLLDEAAAAEHRLHRERGQMGEERAPVRPRDLDVVDHLVVARGRRLVVGEQALGDRRHR